MLNTHFISEARPQWSQDRIYAITVCLHWLAPSCVSLVDLAEVASAFCVYQRHLYDISTAAVLVCMSYCIVALVIKFSSLNFFFYFLFQLSLDVAKEVYNWFKPQIFWL